MRRALACLVAALAALPALATPELPGDSVYQLRLALETQRGEAIGLDRHRGHPVLMSMFYASCPHVCPTLIAKIRHVERQLPDDSRQRLRVLLVSLDPERDTPPRLLELAERHRVDLARWSFARAAAADVRRLAAALGIRYRQLPDREFNHSTVIVLLDAEGRIVNRTSRLGLDDPDFVQAVRDATALRPPPARR